MESTVLPGSLATVVENDQICQVEGQGRGSDGRWLRYSGVLLRGPLGV